MVSFGAWLSPVERCVRVAEVPGSNPGAPIYEESGSGRLGPDSAVPRCGAAPCDGVVRQDRRFELRRLDAKRSSRSGSRRSNVATPEVA